MNILAFHQQVLENYRSYIKSFINIKDRAILQFVEKKIDEGKLWPEPLVQFNPTFEIGRPIGDLNLHPELQRLFAKRPLYRHQEEAILLGAAGKEFVVTSGTGSGKSLTYIATIFNHILNECFATDGKVQAVVVYPMNALINSQNEEIKKYEISYLEQFGSVDKEGKTNDQIIKELNEKTGRAFPITYAQYTGQEDDAARRKIQENKPHILLTNYMMLELIMTRGGEDVELRQNILEGMRYLVFDELHTYRGRQGSDVSMLIRRIRAAAAKEVLTIGTSATMVSADHTTLLEQRREVANVASKIFASTFTPDQIISEYLVASLAKKNVTADALRTCVLQPVPINASAEQFEQYETAIWLEQNVALEEREGRLVRRKPITLSDIAENLAIAAGVEKGQAKQHLSRLLEWANGLNSAPDKQRNYLPFRIHQFVAQTGSVYATLGSREARQLRLEAGLYADKHTNLYPILFSRDSGHEFYCVRLNEEKKLVLPREPFDQVADDDEDLDTEQVWIGPI
jgi:hypothetical protein